MVPFIGREEKENEKQEKEQDWDENHAFGFAHVKFEVLEQSPRGEEQWVSVWICSYPQYGYIVLNLKR